MTGRHLARPIWRFAVPTLLGNDLSIGKDIFETFLGLFFALFEHHRDPPLVPRGIPSKTGFPTGWTLGPGEGTVSHGLPFTFKDSVATGSPTTLAGCPPHTFL